MAAFAKSAISGPSLARSRAKYKRWSGEENKNPNNLKVTVLKPVSIKDGMRTTDYGLRTTDYGLRTTGYGVGIKHGLGIKRGLSITDWVKNTDSGIKRGPSITDSV